MARADDFLEGLSQWGERSSTNFRRAALTINVSLDVNADDKDEPSSWVDLCTQKKACQAAK